MTRFARGPLAKLRFHLGFLILYNVRVELKDLYILLRAKRYLIFLSAVLFGLFGIGVYYFFPQSFIASGSFFVVRMVEDNSGSYFAYEGYYAQQTAFSHSDTVLGLFNSVNVRKNALEGLGIVVNETSLRKLNRSIRVKKEAPQIITLNVKGRSISEAGSGWVALSKAVLNTHEILNQKGDPKLSLSMVESLPVVHKTYRSLYLSLIVGILFGVFMPVIYMVFAEYVRKEL